MKKFLQSFGKSLLMPISTLAAAGIFLGLAAALQNREIVGESFVQLSQIQNFIGFIRRLSGFLFGNLPIFFCISVAAGMSKDEKPTAIYSAVMGFIAFHLSLNYLLGLDSLTPATTSVKYLMENSGLSQVEASLINSKYETVLGYFTYRMNVFGGILVGIVVSYLHNKFYKIKLPDAINFFGGKRFIPLVTLLVIPILALISYYVWPFIDGIIASFGRAIEYTGVLGAFIYGFLNRLLIPTGLHHILNQLVRFTPIGGSAEINGEIVTGSLSIFNTLLSNPALETKELLQQGTKYIGQGHMLIVMFGLPAACIAIIKNARDKNKEKTKALIGAALAASFLTGITEPIEFAFMFVSPMLFIFHAVMTGISYMAVNIAGTAVGGIQGGLIDFIVFGVLKGAISTWYMIPVIGILFALTYFFVFDWSIRKFNILTPGREDDFELEDIKYSKKVGNELVNSIVQGLGGKENILSVDNCFTRLRVRVSDSNKISEDILKKSSPSGIKKIDNENIQIIYGLKVESIASEVKEFLRGLN